MLLLWMEVNYHQRLKLIILLKQPESPTIKRIIKINNFIEITRITKIMGIVWMG